MTATATAPILPAVQRPPRAYSRAGPLVTLAWCWVGGITLGFWAPWPLWWLAAAGLAAGMMVVTWRRGRDRAARIWALVAVVALGPAYLHVRHERVSGGHISAYLRPESQLAQFTGRVVGPPRLAPPQRGAFAGFSYQSPATLFVLELDSLWIEGRWQAVTGRLLVRLDEVDYRLRPDLVIRATGWLSSISGPGNPGEMDFRAVMRMRGIDGRLSIPSRYNWAVVAEAPPTLSLGRQREAISDAAAEALRLGMQENAQRLGFLETILLGRWSRDLGELETAFRRTGLIHILSISGAHVAIFLSLVWGALRVLGLHPRRVAWLVLAVLALYLAAIPWWVPVIRAGLMAGVFGVAYGTGRLARGLELVGLAAILALLLNPADLRDPGFQLSFGITAGLLAFTRPVGRWLWNPARLEIDRPTRMDRAMRWAGDFVAVNLVAFVLALPAVAFHFGFVTPLAMVLSVLSLPVVTAVIMLGYLKIAVGLALPGVGQWLACPLEWAADWMTGLTSQASAWPGAAIELPRGPSLLWTVTATAFAVAVLAGWLNVGWRRVAGAALVLAAWLGMLCYLPQQADRIPAGLTGERPAMRVNMLAVGDGSCILVRLADRPRSLALPAESYTMLFDCGSQGYFDVGARSVVPALRQLGVRRIDTMVISHADIDHFSGCLDVADGVAVARVLTPQALLDEAAEDEKSTSAFLLRGLRERGVPVFAVGRGWSERRAGAQVQALWPRRGYVAKRTNDTSLVLSVRLECGRRLMLCGDIQPAAIRELLDAGDDYGADLCELPHHGSYSPSARRWLEEVRPRMVLQSSGMQRLRRDPWPTAIQTLRARRLVTGRDGMIEVSVERDGRMRWSTFVDR